jgi:adenine-specific DNA-methyltransferase
MDAIQKFQELLKGLFQFETSDLEFGIYRILNYKRDQIRKFIEQDLVNKVESAFANHKDERLTNITQKFDEVKEKIVQSLGKEAFTPTSELKEQFKDTPLGRDYLSIKAQKDEAKTIDEIKLQVFNDLYSFFSRFYEEGDFIPQYRYSIKGHKYAIPYNGEEVKLYWANNEQYYTKTGLLFRDYKFKANDYKIIFRIFSAKEELGSKKATKERFFILEDENPLERADNKTLIIHFQYRELSEREVKSYQVEGGSNTSKQEKINQRSYKKILNGLKDIELKERLGKEHKNEKPLLFYQISRFAAKNTKDYFIHKDLKKFLSEQLDYFIKAEVLSIETLEKERFLDKHITRAKVVREIGDDIIDFLSQIEDFQKRLWEKKKFVLKTDYVITTDRVPEEFHEEIWNNKVQKKEWKELGFELPETREDLKKKKLPIDTKHFSQEFKERLLEKITENADLDDILDGVLIKSENWQALNLLLGKYKDKVKCIYIDPPYNTGSDEFLYKDRFRHSSWITMMSDRLEKGWDSLRKDGVIFVSNDLHEHANLINLMKSLFGPDNLLANFYIKVRHEGRILTGDKKVQEVMENVTCFRKSNFEIAKIKLAEQMKEYKFKVIEKIKTPKTIKIGGKNIQVFSKGEYEIVGLIPDINLLKRISIRGTIRKGNSSGRFFVAHIENRFDPGLLLKVEGIGDDGLGYRYFLIPEDAKNGLYFQGLPLTRRRKDKPYPTFYDLVQEFNVVGYEGAVDFRHGKKPVAFLLKLYEIGNLSKNDLVLDFFAGSGSTAHAVMKLNKEDGGKRKFILVEMADYFDTVMIPRLKKVAYSLNWKDGKPKDTDGIRIFFKYQILEQYEDTLDNIELKENQKAQELFKDEYLLRYFLEFESRESPYLPNINMLKNPFSYKLKVNLEEVGEPQEIVMDIPETFNYLLGLKVKKIKVRNNGRKYLFMLGEKEGREIAIAWREYEDNWTEEDLKKDKEFIIKELKSWTPHSVYVNGQSVLTPKFGKHTVEIRHIEPEFKKLMES